MDIENLNLDRAQLARTEAVHRGLPLYIQNGLRITAETYDGEYIDTALDLIVEYHDLLGLTLSEVMGKKPFCASTILKPV